MTAFGIPYAFGEMIAGQLHRVCPVCGERCPERTDATGEQTTNSYAEHYEREHEEAA